MVSIFFSSVLVNETYFCESYVLWHGNRPRHSFG